MNQEKQEVLENAVWEGNENGYISWDGILDICDEDNKLVNWLVKKLEKMQSKGKIKFELNY